MIHASRVTRHLPRLALLLSCTLALALRLHRLGDANVWWDEGFGVWLARMSVPDAIIRTAYDVHPPLYYVLLHYWRLAAGESEFALRFLSLLWGVLLVAVTFRLGSRAVSPGAGVISAVMVAVTPFSLVWPQQIRMYSLVTFLGMGSTWLLLGDWRHWRRPAAYVVAVLAMLHSHALAALFLPLHGALWLARLAAGRRAGWWHFPVAQAAVAVGMVPWLAVFLPRLTSWSAAQPMSPGPYLLAYWSALVRGTAVNLEQEASLLGLAAALFLVSSILALRPLRGIRRARHPKRETRWALILGVLLPPLLVYLLSQPRSLFYSPPPEPRYLSPFSPFVYLLWAAGIAEAWRRWRPGGVVLLAGSLLCLSASLPQYYRQRVPQDDYRSAACTLETYRRPDDLVFLHTDSDWPVFAYHYAGGWQGVPNDVRWDDASAAGFLGQFIRDQQVAWLLLTPDALRADPGLALERELARWCEEDGCQVSQWRMGERRLLRFSRGLPLPTPSLAPALVRHQHGFEGLWWPYRRARVHEEWRLYAWWPGGPPFPRLELVAPDGQALRPEPTSDEGAQEGLVRLEYRFLPGQTGRHRLRIAGGAGISEEPTDAIMTLAVEGLETAQEWPGGPFTPVEVSFGEVIRLQGASLSTSAVTAGEELCVSLQWAALRRVDQSYTVFVHLLGEMYNADRGNFLWGQHDGRPVEGFRPTTSWAEGEIILDRHCFSVDGDAPTGPYLIEAGLYDATSGARLPVTAGEGEGDRVLVGTVEVVRAE